MATFKETFERVKSHVRSNKKIYIAVGITFVATAAGAVILTRSGNVSISNPALFNYKPSASTVQVSMTRPGPKAFVIQASETQQVWPSLRAAAKDLGHNPGTLSAHLNGKVSDIDGLHLVKLAEV